MKLNEIVDHCAYQHRTLGPVWVVGRHPFDGAAIIVLHTVEKEDVDEYRLCVSEDFVNLLTDRTHAPTHGRALDHFNHVARGAAPVTSIERQLAAATHTLTSFGFENKDGRGWKAPTGQKVALLLEDALRWRKVMQLTGDDEFAEEVSLQGVGAGIDDMTHDVACEALRKILTTIIDRHIEQDKGDGKWQA